MTLGMVKGDTMADKARELKFELEDPRAVEYAWTAAAVIGEQLQMSKLRDARPVETGYTELIEQGQYFIWEPTNPRAWTLVKVVEVQDVTGDERRIHTETIRGRDAVGNKVWNDEGRFREACVRCDEKGVPL